MASTALRDAGAMPVPQEILQLICKNLDRSDLKNLRLARRELNDAAEIQLFRHIYLRRNMDSFCRLRMIASSPHIAKLVKGLFYSSQLLEAPEEPVDFDTWCRSYLGDGLGYIGHPIEGTEELLSNYLLKSCTTADLYRYYSSWCAHIHSQRLMEKYDIEEKDLEDAFSRLSQLEEIYFGPLFSAAKELPAILRGMKPDQSCSLGREVMVQPSYGSHNLVRQFTSMMAAAYKNNKELKVIEGSSLPWKIFQQQDEVLAMMKTSMRYCEHFKWSLLSWTENVNGDLQIGSMMRNAPRLRTIGLDFGTDTSLVDGNMSNLSRILVDHYHWPNLNRVQLYGFKVSNIHLRGFLAAHAASLTSLDLAKINLTSYEWEGKPHYSSWTKLIIFLQESLNLRKMHFSHSLFSEGDENWWVVDGDEARRIAQKWYGGGLTVKERVERYVVNGGEFPLPWPSEAEDESRWRDVLLDFESRFDATWRYYPTVSSALLHLSEANHYE